MTKRVWIQKSTIAVMMSTSLLMFAEGGQAAAISQNSVKSDQVVTLTKSLIGKDFKYGAEGPTQFGSAGLATYIYGKVGIKIDDTIAELYGSGKKVDKDNLLAGDLLFFSSKGSGAPTFMGIYIGSNSFIYSSMGEDAVVERRLSDYTDKLLGAKRFIPTEKVTEAPVPDNSTVMGDKVVKAGLKYLGTPYQYASTRSTKSTMDCSEFTMWAYRDAGIDMGRSGAQSQAKYVMSKGHYTYDKSKLKKGDLVFFMSYKGWRESDYKGVNPRDHSITHVGIYMGNDKILHTYSKEAGGVVITDFSDKHWEWRFIMGGRPY